MLDFQHSPIPPPIHPFLFKSFSKKKYIFHYSVLQFRVSLPNTESFESGLSFIGLIGSAVFLLALSIPFTYSCPVLTKFLSHQYIFTFFSPQLFLSKIQNLANCFLQIISDIQINCQSFAQSCPHPTLVPPSFYQINKIIFVYNLLSFNSLDFFHSSTTHLVPLPPK